MYDLFLPAWPSEGRIQATLGAMHGVQPEDVAFAPEDDVALLSSLRDDVLLVEYERIGGDYPVHLIVIPRFAQKTVSVHEAAARVARECSVEVIADDGSDNPVQWSRYMPDGRVTVIHVDPLRADALYVASLDFARVAD